MLLDRKSGYKVDSRSEQGRNTRSQQSAHKKLPNCYRPSQGTTECQNGAEKKGTVAMRNRHKQLAISAQKAARMRLQKKGTVAVQKIP